MDEKLALLEMWDMLREQVKIEYDIMDIAYDTWIVPLKLFSVKDGVVKIVIPKEMGDVGFSMINRKYNFFR